MAEVDSVEIKDAKHFFAKNKATTTLFVGNLPQTISQNKLEKLFSDVGPIRRSFVVRNKGVGYVTFAVREDAEKAIRNGVAHEGKRLNLKFAKKRSEQLTQTFSEAEVKARKHEEKEKSKHEKPKHVNLKKGKLIVRNISFKADENAVRNEFSKFGNITDVIIPKKPDGKMRGFCFVQFKNTLSANKAVQAMNGKEWMGRPIAIDFSLPKLKYLDLKQTEKNNSGTDSEPESEDDGDATVQVPSTTSSINHIEDGTKIEMKKKKHVKVNASSDRSFSRDDEVHDFKDSESDEDDELESDGDEDNDGKEENENEIDDEEEEEDVDDNEEEGEDDEEDEREKPKVSQKKPEPKASDVGEGKTLFIRNLSFETTKEQLKEAFILYGELHYAIVCIDPSTEYSKGSGFVKFRNKEDAEACLAKSEEKDGILLDGHKLTVSVAMSKEELKRKAEDKAKKPKDSRNLYLAREGLIRPGTEAAKDVSKADLEKRVKLEVWKHGMLRNLNVFVSRYRLCVRNIPLTVGDKRLRKIFEDAAGDGAEVTEARIMRDIRQVSANGEAASKGYGFVRFTSHDHALKALRHTNNNPDIFTKNTRPIVEFSLENREALNAKQKRQDKSVENNKMNSKVQQKFMGKGKSGNVAKHLTDDGSKQLPFSGTKSNPAEKKGLPSHVGPKIRHNGRRKTPKISRQKLRRDKIKMMKNKRQQKWDKAAPAIATVKPPKKKRPVDRDEAHLQKLVSSHKRKRRGDNKSAGATPKKSAKRSKWFA